MIYLLHEIYSFIRSFYGAISGIHRNGVRVYRANGYAAYAERPGTFERRRGHARKSRWSRHADYEVRKHNARGVHTYVVA